MLATEHRALFEQAIGIRALAQALPKLQAAALRKLADDCEAEALAQVKHHRRSILSPEAMSDSEEREAELS